MSARFTRAWKTDNTSCKWIHCMSLYMPSSMSYSIQHIYTWKMENLPVYFQMKHQIVFNRINKSSHTSYVQFKYIQKKWMTTIYLFYKILHKHKYLHNRDTKISHLYLFIHYFPQSCHLNLKTYQHTKIPNMNCFTWLILMFNINQSKVTTPSTQFSAILNLHVPLCSLLMWLTISHKLNTFACYLSYVCTNRYTVYLQSIWIYELSTPLVQQAEIKYIYI